MTALTYIALTGCLFVLAMGGATMVAGKGYSFDLRRKSRRGAPVRADGRRSEDLAARRA